jgi:cytochrome c oxidase assembly protein subunit 15
MLHRFAKFVAGCTVLLVLAGSLVTSTGSGLSVPDWPTSYGWNMFTFPPSKWVGGILYEHGHRLIASTVGCLTIVLAVWLWVQEPRRWLKWLGISALVAVVAQGVLGGLTVLFFLPPAVSTAHAGLAEVFFCLVVSIALFTSPEWIDGYGRIGRLNAGSVARARPGPDQERRLGILALAATAVIYTQILAGATMRHTGAGLAIPDFPLMLGHLVPQYWDPKIAIHFTHRVGALVVVLVTLLTAGHVWRHFRDWSELVRPAALLVALVIVQAALGALTVLSRLNVLFNSVHVVCGALVLATSVIVTLRAWRGSFVDVETVRLNAYPEISSNTSAARVPPTVVSMPGRHSADGARVHRQADRGVQA